MRIQTLTKNIGNILNNGHYRGHAIDCIYRSVAFSSRIIKIQYRPDFIDFCKVLEAFLFEFESKRGYFVEWCELHSKDHKGEIDTRNLGILEDVYLKCKVAEEKSLLLSELSIIEKQFPPSRKL